MVSLSFLQNGPCLHYSELSAIDVFVPQAKRRRLEFAVIKAVC